MKYLGFRCFAQLSICSLTLSILVLYIYIYIYFLHVGEYIIQLKHVHTYIQQKKAKKNDKQTNYTINIQNMVSGFK